MQGNYENCENHKILCNSGQICIILNNFTQEIQNWFISSTAQLKNSLCVIHKKILTRRWFVERISQTEMKKSNQN